MLYPFDPSNSRKCQTITVEASFKLKPTFLIQDKYELVLHTDL